MADSDGITEFQSFSERTLKYGRNLMVVGVIAGVFAYVPAIDLAGSKPFNFKIEAGGEVWVWRMVAVVLFYYAARFVALAIPDYLKWKRDYGAHGARQKISVQQNVEEVDKWRRALQNAEQSLAERSERPDTPNKIENAEASVRSNNDNTRSAESNLAESKHTAAQYWLRRVPFWVFDAGLPTAIGIAGMVACFNHDVPILMPLLMPTGCPYDSSGFPLC